MAKQGTGSVTGRRQMIVGALLALAGGGAVFYFATVGGGHGAGAVTSKSAIVVAAHDIPLRTQLKLSDLTTVSYDIADLPPNVFSKPADAVGLVTGVAISAHQPLTANLVVKSADSLDTARADYLPIPSGYVAVAVPNGEQQGVSGHIKSDDFITVIAVVQGASSKYSVVRTVFTNLKVIDAGTAGSALTVLVTQCQAEYLQWFLKNASSVIYTLESYHDYSPTPSKPDPSCASITNAGGVSAADVARKFPDLGL